MDNLKNIVVLKNLPSNIIDEALLILKPNQKIKNLEYTPKQNGVQNSANSQDYIVKEAEMVISTYLTKNDITGNKKIENLEKKNKRLKILSIILAGIIMTWTIINAFLWIKCTNVA